MDDQRVAPRHGDIEQPAFFLNPFALADTEAGGNAAVDDIEHEEILPFLPFCRMDRRQEQLVVVAMRRPRVVAAWGRRIECKVRREAFACQICSGLGN